MSTNKPIGMHTIASLPSVLAVFMFSPNFEQPAMSGDGALTWRAAAIHTDAIARDLKCDDLRLVCGDAQIIRYVRDGDTAIAVVTVPAIGLAKRLARMMRSAIRNERAIFRHQRDAHAAAAAVRKAAAA